MASREELIQAEMVAIRTKEEEKRQAEIQAKIQAEARLRVETEKLTVAIEYGDVEAITNLAGDLRNYNFQSGSPCESIKRKARQYLQDAQNRKVAEEKKKKDMDRIAKEAFDRAQKEAELAAIPLDMIILQLADCQDYCKKYGGTYIINSGLNYIDKQYMEDQVNRMKKRSIEYGAELDRRRALDSDTVERRIILAPIEKKKQDEEAAFKRANPYHDKIMEAVPIILAEIENDTTYGTSVKNLIDKHSYVRSNTILQKAIATKFGKYDREGMLGGLSKTAWFAYRYSYTPNCSGSCGQPGSMPFT